ncbi:MAG: sigma-70 family RNA polymerase sigma factor [Muribaculaceae bacterium]|nr:sigma-70 family RNA polymerase sigma factor [Muribaculaceae bacterium]MBR0024766.1 sigma-70 family RNA polymerase sigma factor [Muribaculaceae bacterium]
MGEKEFESRAIELREKAIATCLSCGADAMQAEDVAQDVLLRLWQLRDTLDRYRSLEALVVVMARHNLASLHRNDNNNVPIMSVNPKQLKSQLITPDDSLISSQEVAWLNSAMQRLPSTQYAVLHMRQVECLSYDEIACRLGIENSTARSLLSRARFKLLNEIKKRKF